MRSRTYSRWVLSNLLSLTLVAVVVLLAGCGGINPQPFENFSGAMRQVKEGTDGVLSKNIEWEREWQIYEVMEGKKKLEYLKIERKGEFEWTYVEKNLASKYDEVRSIFKALSDATLKYADLLAAIAGAELITEEEYEKVAKETYEQLNSLITRLNVEVSGDAVGLFSIGAIEIGKQVLEAKRRKDLARLLTNNQANIEGFSYKTIALINSAERTLNNSYEKLFEMYDEQLKKNQSRVLVEKVEQLGPAAQKSVTILKEARDVCEKIPAAHKELLKSVEEIEVNFEAIRDLYASGKRMQRLYKELKEESKKEKGKGEREYIDVGN